MSFLWSGVPTENKFQPLASLGGKSEEKLSGMVKHNGALLPIGTVSKTRTQVRGMKTKKSGKKSGRKNGPQTAQQRFGDISARDGKLFNSTGRPAFWKTPTNNAVFRVIQSYETTAQAVSSASVATFSNMTFLVSVLDQISSLVAVFDQFKIEAVEVWLTPRLSVFNGANTNPGLFHSVIDYDDASNLSTVAQALDYANVLVSSSDSGHYRCFVPHVAIAAYQGAFTGFSNATSPWIDAASTGVQHYGIKTAWTTTDAVYTIDAVVRLHTAWRNVR